MRPRDQIIGAKKLLLKSLKPSHIISFLSQINFLWTGQFKRRIQKHIISPTVTVEPKFNSTDTLRLLLYYIRELHDTLQIPHVAVIVSSQKELKIIEDFMELSLNLDNSFVAIAIRSKPKSAFDFIWNGLNTEKQSIVKRNNDGDNIPSFTSKMAQILMPDIKLFPSNFKLSNTLGSNHIMTHKYMPSHNSLRARVITWLIDTEDGMWQTLLQGFDGIISNNPLWLLRLLRKRYRNFCFE